MGNTNAVEYTSVGVEMHGGARDNEDMLEPWFTLVEIAASHLPDSTVLKYDLYTLCTKHSSFSLFKLNYL